METPPNKLETIQQCFHCGDAIRGEHVEHDGKHFCCSGCKVVYEILQQNNLCQYYHIESAPGISPSEIESSRFGFLDEESVQKNLFTFSDGITAAVTLPLPGIHCSSCIWLLEQLYKFDPGISQSRVDFLKKQISITFHHSQTSLKKIVILLTSLGYDPELRLETIEKKVESDLTRTLYYKIGVAGFCFGNSMLFSFPEYLGVDAGEKTLRTVFSYMNLLVGIPVFFYSSNEYFRSAWGGVKRKIINIDVPIAIGIILLFARSSYEIVTGSGSGFIDSMCGLVFFLLLGRLFQSKTYDRLNFERNYKSYFPLSVTVKKDGSERSVSISSLKKGDRIVVRNNEIIPADGLLLRGNAAIDYSFVTGESRTVEKVLGEMIFAGGRQVGSIIEVEVTKEVSQSYLTQLWNNFTEGSKSKHNLSEISNTISKYFTIVLLMIAGVVGIYWMTIDVTTAITVFTGILIVACPCALALSIPFTFGTAMRILGKNNFFVKNVSVIEYLSNANRIVFDKTGTITYAQRSSITYRGDELTRREIDGISSLTKNSAHLLSRLVFEYTHGNEYPVQEYSEDIGKGIQGVVRDGRYKIGSREYVGGIQASEKINETRVYISIDGVVRGYYAVSNVYRSGLKDSIRALKDKYKFSVISGDNESERLELQKVFPSDTDIRFHQLPNDKYEYICGLQKQGYRTIMVGDGLNDAGALMKSDVGIALTENISKFSPSSDVIMDSASFDLLPKMLRFTRESAVIVKISFALSFLYNIIGLFFAVRGELSPIVAAILMPISSITIVLFTTLTTKAVARKTGLI